ncbi:MAG: aminotransferase class V-fold PLP-dependent enzyme [Gemmatimonadota bacterium]
MSLSGRCWLPGPVEADSEVMAAMLHAPISHRGREGRALAERLQGGLRKLFQTSRPVIQTTGSATAMMEAAIRSGVRERVLAIVHGTFGERFARIAEACDKEVIRLHTAHDRVMEPADLEAMLDGPPIDAITMVHVETSTGAVAPIAELLPICRRLEDAVTIVDVVGSLGGMPVKTSEWNADFVLASSQKAVGAPPGITMAVASDQFLTRAGELDDRGRYLDVVSLHRDAREGRFPQTPALPIAWALDAQLQRISQEGLPARFARHAAMQARVAAWMEGRGDVHWFMPSERRSNTVSVLRLPDERPATALVDALAEEGWLVAPGMESETDQLLRIGHLGDATPEQLDGLLAALDRRLAS